MLSFPAVSAQAAAIEHALTPESPDLPDALAALEAMAAGFVADLTGAPPIWLSDDGAAGPARVLVVEDDAEERQVTTAALKSAGFLVSTTSSAEEAMRLARTQQPDLILLDIDLPALDELAFCQQLKLDPELSAIPIVVVTGQGALIDRMAVLAIGADDYVRKPLAPGELLIRVRRLLASAAPSPTTAGDARPEDAILSYEDFSMVARDALARGPSALVLIRVPPALRDTLAEHLVGELRRRDFLGRYSPSHLILLAPDLTAAAVRATVEQVTEALESPDRRKIAIGAVDTEDGAAAAGSFDALLARADMALAEARVAGSDHSERPVVLVAEDDPDVQEVVDTHLRGAGFQTLMAFDGAQALEMVTQHRPDVLLLEVTMAKLTGFDVLSRLREMGEDRPLTIVVSARERDDDVTRAFELGADDYVSKPFNPDELVARIARLLR
jgi:DNA-binding response OmpR family regulator